MNIHKLKTTGTAYLLGLLSVFSVLLPAPVLAQQTPGASAARDFVDTLNEVIIFPLIALLLGVAFLLFLYGCAEYIMGTNNPAAREKGVKYITFGIIGLVVMVSAWGILTIVVSTFGLSL